jgi:hypothetical protein
MPALLELIPGVSRNTFRDNDPNAAAADAEYRAKRPGVLAQHQYRCNGCGVVSVGAMEVHHADCNHANNDPKNLTPDCVFCHPVNHIGEAATRFNRVDQAEVAGGYVSLSYLPEISQSDLSHLMRTIGHVMTQGTAEQKEEARALYEHLCGYAGYVASTWGTSRAGLFAIALRECSAQVYEQRKESMKGIRVIFSLEAVKKLSEKFMQEFLSIPMASWGAIVKQRYPR